MKYTGANGPDSAFISQVIEQLRLWTRHNPARFFGNITIHQVFLNKVIYYTALEKKYPLSSSWYLYGPFAWGLSTYSSGEKMVDFETQHPIDDLVTTIKAWRTGSKLLGDAYWDTVKEDSQTQEVINRLAKHIVFRNRVPIFKFLEYVYTNEWCPNFLKDVYRTKNSEYEEFRKVLVNGPFGKPNYQPSISAAYKHVEALSEKDYQKNTKFREDLALFLKATETFEWAVEENWENKEIEALMNIVYFEAGYLPATHNSVATASSTDRQLRDQKIAFFQKTAQKYRNLVDIKIDAARDAM